MEFLIVSIIMVAIIIFDKYNKENIIKNKEKNYEKNQEKKLIMPYESKFLLTKTEYYFYNILKQKCDANNLLICPKVRLEDFINVKTRDYKETLKYRGYIKSRHVDFIICDSKLRIIAGIELDDKSHESAKAIKTDNFKNELFNTINIKLFRIKTTNIYEKEIDNMINYINLTIESNEDSL